MIYIGIDPGVNGGIAWWQQQWTKPYAVPMPKTIEGIVMALKNIRQHAGTGQVTAVIEQVCGFMGDKGQGKTAYRLSGVNQFTFGKNTGVLTGACFAFGFQVRTVRPQVWQLVAGVGKRHGRTDREWKAWLKRRAKELHPDMKITLATADALLILRYARCAA